MRPGPSPRGAPRSGCRPRAGTGCAAARAHPRRTATARWSGTGPRGPQPLLGALGVVADDAVSGVQDGLARAVVLLQPHDLGVGVVLAEIEDIAHVRAAEAIDRLVVVADHHHVAVLLREQVHQDVLGAVGVLVLVYE